MSKKKEYIKQWIGSHPQIRIYLNKEEYETIKQIAKEKKLSFKQILLKGIEYLKGEGEEYKKGYNEGYEKGYNSGYAAALLDIREGNKNAEERLKILRLEFIPCIICGKPLPGLVVPKDQLGYAVKEFVYKSGWMHVKCPIL
jgi:flagellar biosynthesis/type III secretory pathway protein FliH